MTTPLKTFSAVYLLAFSIGCNDASFEGTTGGSKSAKNKKEPESEISPEEHDDEETPDLEGIDPSEEIETEDDSNATTIYEDKKSGVRREIFNFGTTAKAPLVDFVFVIDNSVSMNSILTNTAKGFDSLANDDVWPERSLVAVMSTMTGDTTNFTKTHKDISRYASIDSEPGFLDFVNKAAIDKFKAASTNVLAKKWDIDGCGDKWFKPNAKNANGDSCFKAHTQSSNHGVGCEQGISAVAQLFEKNKGKALFRKGALLNFIFVSDTHDPGCGNSTLTAPTLATLKSKIESDNVLAGIKFHALAPEKKCTAEDIFSKSYFTLTDATKGVKQDPCNLTDYSSFIKQMVTEAVKQEDGIFVTSKAPLKIVRVTLDGKEIDNYEFDKERNTISIPDLDPSKEHKIEVTYQFKTGE